MQLNDTIVALSSPQGADGIRAIVRLSGPAAWELTQSVAHIAETRIGWHDAPLEFDGLRFSGHIILFQSPKSFTGQDVAELHVPHSPALVAALTQALLRAGAAHGTPIRLAEPGEFSARAFFNGKIDLTEAEGIAATIAAGSDAQLRAAAGLRKGDLHRWTRATADKLADLLARVEAGIDFVDEDDVRFIEPPELIAALAQLRTEIASQLTAAIRIDRLDAPPAIVFTGKPNVGKSSLINALAGRDRSIVSPIAGTTRDMLATDMHVEASIVRLIDVPGEEAPTDELREKMMAARDAALLDADLIVQVIAATDEMIPEPPDPRHIVVMNKVDLLQNSDPRVNAQLRAVSAKTGQGIAALRSALAQITARKEHTSASRLVLNHRHREILQQSLRTLEHAHAAVASTLHPELLAAELRHALDQLGQMTGTLSPDEVLGRVFAQFCIGK
jgi:tRNA modification GTPase